MCVLSVRTSLRTLSGHVRPNVRLVPRVDRTGAPWGNYFFRSLRLIEKEIGQEGSEV